jgi:hypothetical protein
MIEYQPEFKNRTTIYGDICFIMNFAYNLLLDYLDKESIYSIGVQAQLDSKPYLYIISPNDSIKAMKSKNWIYWLRNSLINEPFRIPQRVLLLVEGPTEMNSYPLLFESLGKRIDAHGIDILPYAESNLETLLAFLNYNKEKFYLTCDKDKRTIVMDMKRRGYLNSNYHILEKGEFEDYINAEDLAIVLRSIDPDIEISKEYIEERKNNGKNASRIISEYYYSIGQTNRFPGKPKLGQEIANHWISKGIPKEIRQIINEVLNIV